MTATTDSANPADFLASVHALFDAGNVDDAMYMVADWVDRMFCSGAFFAVDEVLGMVDAAHLDEDMLVGFLAATYPARHLLSARVKFAEVVRTRLANDIGKAEADTLVDDLI
jgi:hypothetical protein